MAQIATVFFLIIFFGGSLVVTFFLARRNKSTNTYLVAGNQITPWQNALAVAGDYIAAASLLGIVGATSLTGLSGFFYALGIPLSFVMMAILVVEPLRNLGKFTFTDVLTYRFESRAVRLLAGIVALIISANYLLGNFVGAGILISTILHVDYVWGLLAGSIVIACYVVFGGMLAVTWIQIFKTLLLIVSVIGMASVILYYVNWNPINLFHEAATQVGPRFLTSPHPIAMGGKLDTVSYIFTAIGVLGMPHVLIRFLTVSDARAARKSIGITVWIITLITAGNALLGLGAAVIVGPNKIAAAHSAGTLATPMLAEAVGGPILYAFISAVIFAAIAAVVAGVVVSVAGTFSHDIYANVIRPQSSDHERLVVARIAAALICGVALFIAIEARSLNLAYIAGISVSIAGAANMPVFLMAIFWRRFNAMGALCGLGGGTVFALLYFCLGPTIMGPSAWIPVPNIGILAIPTGAACAWVGTLLGRSSHRQSTDFEEMAVATLIRI